MPEVSSYPFSFLKFSALQGIGALGGYMERKPQNSGSKHSSPARRHRNLWRRRKLALVCLVEGSLARRKAVQQKWCRAAGDQNPVAHSKPVAATVDSSSKLNELLETILGDSTLPFSVFFQKWRDREHDAIGRKRDVFPVPYVKSWPEDISCSDSLGTVRVTIELLSLWLELFDDGLEA